MTMTSTSVLQSETALFGTRAKAASKSLAIASTNTKNRFLACYADRIKKAATAILAANAKDTEAASSAGISGAFLDRLALNSRRLDQILEGLGQVVSLPDPIGGVRETRTMPNGLHINKVGVPLGVVFFIYESRPNVTVDAVALCVKSGNSVLLRGGSEAYESNRIFADLASQALIEVGLSPDSVILVPPRPRELVDLLLADSAHVDLVIPRGGKDLITRVVSRAKMPVIKHYTGNCHVYIEASADPKMAIAIVVNAKCQRPGTCNAAESLLIDRSISPTLLPQLLTDLDSSGVEIRGCPETIALFPKAKPASEEDYFTEYNDLVISVRVVADMNEAIERIQKFGSGHTEAIVTSSEEKAKEFTHRVDSSAVMVNASTRFNDGFELGLGAEIGISTDKFHARGPCGLMELTSTKYIVQGNGHVRN